MNQLTESLNLARREIETLRRQEQEAALASAETKQKVHAELLKQEEEMARLRSDREHLNSKIAAMEVEMAAIKEETTKQLQEAEMVLELEKQRLLKVQSKFKMLNRFLKNNIFIWQELSRGKTEALKLMDEDMDHRVEQVKKEKDAHWEAVLTKKFVFNNLTKHFIKLLIYFLRFSG